MPHPSRLLLLATALAATPLVACGPFFPNCYLSNSLEDLSKLPRLSFETELVRVLPRGSTAAPTETDDSERAREERRDRVERAQVRAAFLARGVGEQEAERLARSHQRLTPDERLPREFHLYAEAARAWHGGRCEQAVDRWRSLLALPASERHWRTVWSAYMAGRALHDTKPAQARALLQFAREAAAQGFADGLDLAADALGWEARSFLLEGNHAAALRLYLRQFQLGVPGSADSLRFAIARALHGDARNGGVPASHEDLAAIATDPRLRAVVAAWFGARGGPLWSAADAEQEDFRLWLSVLPGAESLTPAEADRWSWAAYQCADWETAALLAARAEAEAPAANWVRAMLCLRRGDVAGAAGHLARAKAHFETDPALALGIPPDDQYIDRREAKPRDDLDGIDGVLTLNRGQYAEALRLFLRADHWADAAYVAEVVLTLDELVAFTAAEYPEASAESGTGTGPALRHLLARRLARAARFDEARAWYPEELRATHDVHVRSVRTGYDESRPAAERAAAFIEASALIRAQGMELLGTELAPDFEITGGNHEWPGLWETRAFSGVGSFHAGWSYTPRPLWKEGAPLSPSAEELDRAKAARIPTKRFHYRRRAAELAWLGAALLPNDSEQTAHVLHDTGRWLGPWDPEQANLFYKTLVIRCPGTALAREAAKRHWFVAEKEGHEE